MNDIKCLELASRHFLLANVNVVGDNCRKIDRRKLDNSALCQILLMLVKEFYMILIKALNRTCLFGAFFEADVILFQSNSLQKVSEIRIAIGCAFNLLDFTINAL